MENPESMYGSTENIRFVGSQQVMKEKTRKTKHKKRDKEKKERKVSESTATLTTKRHKVNCAAWGC
jgi:hypothetical protein